MLMKRVLFNILTAVLSITAISCARQFDDEGGQTQGAIRATIVADSYLTKTIVIDTPGKSVDTYWKDGDRMGIFGGSASNLEFSLSPADISEDGKSAVFRSESSVPKGSITAYVPFSASASTIGEELVLEMPAVQHPVFAKGKIQPDPRSNLMVATGSSDSGLTFHNVLSILKIGQVFETDVRLVKVEFRDLDNKPVCGAMRIKADIIPSAVITGEGKVLTLDLGSGIRIAAGEVYPLFMYVPSRSYPKGFELTFITDDGSRIVHTAGSKSGKTLERSIIYTIGDIPALDYVPGAKAVLAPGVTVMTEEKLEMITILSDSERAVLKDKEGNVCYDKNEAAMYRPVFDMLVSEELAPETGKLLLFEGGAQKLPYGGVYRITECTRSGDGYFRVKAYPEADIAQAYEEVSAGTPIFDEDGNEIEGGGIALDLSRNVQSILNERGQEVPFSIDGDGNIVISEEDVADMLGMSTKAFSETYTLPKLSLNLKRPHGEAVLGAQMSIASKFAVGFIAGEFQYVHCTFSPKVTLSADFVLKSEFSISHSMHLFTIMVTPIPIVPGLFLCPEIEFSASAGVGGDLKFSASVKYVYDMGMYGFSYNKGDGFTFRHRVNEPAKDDGFRPELGGVSGSLYAFGAITATPYMSLTGLFGAGLNCTTTLKFGTTWTSTSTKLALTPEIEMYPMTASLGGLFSKSWKNLTTKFEFDPIWEMELTPQMEVSRSPFQEEMTEDRYTIPLRALDPLHLLSAWWPCGLSLPYSVKLKEKYFMPLQIALDIYEGDIHYYPYKWPSLTDSFAINRFDVCEAAGVPTMAYVELGLDNPRRVSREIIGSFPSGETGTITGTKTGFSSGVGYGYRIVVIYPDGTETVMTGGDGTSAVQLTEDSPSKWMTIPGSGLHPAIFFWPTRANGGGYYRSHKEAEEGI